MVDREPVNRARSSQREPGLQSELRARSRPRRSLWLALALSLAAHAALGVIIGTSFAPPEIEIEFQVPVDVELGMTEEVAAAPIPEPPPVPPTTEEAAPAKKPRREPTADAGASDAALADAETRTDAERAASTDLASDAGAGDAASATPLVLADAGPVGARLPPGAQIALRVDMARIRQSPIAEDVRALVAAIPDWKALLDGSGIDPVTQLERLLIMTPNLQREKVALAGRYQGGRAVVDGAVNSLAAARGVEAHWQNKRGFPVATWANADSTPRVIALVGPAHFTISREEDLERVLAVAAARARKGRMKGPPAGEIADGLLAMEENEGLSLEVEGVEQFVRLGQRGIPLRLRAAAIQQDQTTLLLRSTFAYADDSAAADGLDYWKRRAEKWSGNLLVAAAGLSGPLRDAQLEQKGSDLQITLRLSVEQTRIVLGYLRSMFPAQP